MILQAGFHLLRNRNQGLWFKINPSGNQRVFLWSCCLWSSENYTVEGGKISQSLCSMQGLVILLVLLPRWIITDGVVKFWFFRLRGFRRAYDSAYNTDFRFSLGHKHPYDFESEQGNPSTTMTPSPSLVNDWSVQCLTTRRTNQGKLRFVKGHHQTIELRKNSTGKVDALLFSGTGGVPVKGVD